MFFFLLSTWGVKIRHIYICPSYLSFINLKICTPQHSSKIQLIHLQSVMGSLHHFFRPPSSSEGLPFLLHFWNSSSPPLLLFLKKKKETKGWAVATILQSYSWYKTQHRYISSKIYLQMIQREVGQRKGDTSRLHRWFASTFAGAWQRSYHPAGPH